MRLKQLQLETGNIFTTCVTCQFIAIRACKSVAWTKLLGTCILTHACFKYSDIIPFGHEISGVCSLLYAAGVLPAEASDHSSCVDAFVHLCAADLKSASLNSTD